MNTGTNVMVFTPTWAEFQDFSGYVDFMESRGAHKAGIAKVIPPPEWVQRKKKNLTEDTMNMEIPAPICQNVQGKPGIYQQFTIKKNPMTVAEYRTMAESQEYITPRHIDYADLERIYWKTIKYNNRPLYGADVSGSLINKDVNGWNINKLGTILDLVYLDYGITIEGVNSPYLYFGMWKTSFPWHTEDMDLYSINYIHAGSPKSWYAIPPEHGRKFERAASGFFPEYSLICPSFLRHKMTLISPSILAENSIPLNKITQEAGEFIITFPYGYHSGYNHGFNVAEAINFASPRWIEYGKRAKLCNCPTRKIKINMTNFVKRFQPKRYDLWIKGNDVGCHPEVPTRPFPAPLHK